MPVRKKFYLDFNKPAFLIHQNSNTIIVYQNNALKSENKNEPLKFPAQDAKIF